MKILKCFKDPVLWTKAISETIENKTKKQKEVFFGSLLGTWDASLSGDMLLGNGVVRVGDLVFQTSDGVFRYG